MTTQYERVRGLIDRGMMSPGLEAAILCDQLEMARKALKFLIEDCLDYPAWQRPCKAVDDARAALAEIEKDVEG